MRDKKVRDPDTACRLIDEVGSERLQELCGRSPGAISQWKRNGLPEALERFLRAKYGNLRAFGGSGEPGITRN